MLHSFAKIIAICSLFTLAGCDQRENPQQQSEDTAKGQITAFGDEAYFEKISDRKIYDGVQRTAVYVPMRDGVKVAVDIYRPTINGKPTEEALPVLFQYARYWRSTEMANGDVRTLVGIFPKGRNTIPFSFDNSVLVPTYEHDKPELSYQMFLKHGYIVARADARGTGASYGLWHGDMSTVEANDGHDVVEWLAKQSWSTDKVGMIGGSYNGLTQFLTASANPPSLKAIMPQVAPFDEYFTSWAGGGVLRKYGLAWLVREAKRDGVAEGIEDSEINPVDNSGTQVSRVDTDSDGAQRDAARKERLKNPEGTDPTNYFTRQSDDAKIMIEALYKAMDTNSPEQVMEVIYDTDKMAQLLDQNPELRETLLGLHFYRDASSMLLEKQPIGANNLAMLLPEINNSNIAVYNWGGWYDFGALDTVLWHANLSTPKKLIMGPWTHDPDEPGDNREYESMRLWVLETLRWYDYWLKDIDNGIMEEAEIHYTLMNTPSEFSWQTATQWPIANSRSQNYYFDQGPSGSVNSVNDGLMTTGIPEASAQHQYQVDYKSTVGFATRYHDSIGMGPKNYPDLDKHAEKALTFTTPPLTEDVKTTGHPTITLYATSSAPDGDFNVYLQEVHADGTVEYITEGVIRASHRVLGNVKYDDIGLPSSDSRKEIVDQTPALNTETAKIVLALQPTSNVFNQGNRIRVVITGADAHTNLTIPYATPPVVSVFSGDTTRSHISLSIDLNSK